MRIKQGYSIDLVALVKASNEPNDIETFQCGASVKLTTFFVKGSAYTSCGTQEGAKHADPYLPRNSITHETFVKKEVEKEEEQGEVEEDEAEKDEAEKDPKREEPKR